MKKLLCAMVLCSCLTGSAFAGGDGDFCVSNGYLAYSVRDESSSKGEHALNIVRVGGEEGIAGPASVTFEVSRVHGMKCYESEVVIYGWYNRYSIGLAEGARPKINSVESIEEGKIPKEFQWANSFDYAKTDQFDIPSQREDRKYQVVIERSGESYGKRGGRIIYHKTIARVVERDGSNRITKEKKIYDSVRKETIH